MGAFTVFPRRDVAPASVERAELAGGPRVLQRSRRAMNAASNLAGGVVAAGGVTQFTISFPNLIATAVGTDGALPQNTRVRVGILGTVLSTDAGGVPFLQLQAAQLQSASGLLAVPLTSGSPLGLANGAALAGVLEFDSNDLQYIGATSAPSASIVIQIKNSDASNHDVTAFSASVFVETVQYDRPLQGEPI